MHKAVAAFLVALALTPLQAHAATDVYKWIDKNGTPTFGEHPPEGVPYTKMKFYGVARPPSRTQQPAKQAYNPKPSTGLSAQSNNTPASASSAQPSKP
ncbi:DUF4124 domain-containing protein [Motiliproteus sp.]|uniref:DUF4124 domain-containing protein n=1 Tax=Motiliproteus sp. TaxID=1898955 RepID=UPI003BAC6180